MKIEMGGSLFSIHGYVMLRDAKSYRQTGKYLLICGHWLMKKN